VLPLGKPDAPLRVRRSSRDRAHRAFICATRVNLISIVWRAVRRKGIARSAAKKTGTYRFTQSILECFTLITADDKNLAWVSIAIQAASRVVCEK
jgi:hypothetical protein